MECKNCGAEYEEQLAECPYCGAENYKKSVEEHQKILDDYQEKTQKMRALPFIAGEKGVKLVVIAIVSLIVIAMVGSFVVGKVQSWQSEREYEQRLETLRELEDLYHDKEYAALYELWRERRNKSFDVVFQKYIRVGELADGFERSLERMESGIELALMAESNGISDGEKNLDEIGYYIKLLATCSEYETEGYPYGEEEGVTYYSEKITEVLTEQYFLTEEEIHQGIADYIETGEKPTYLYGISYERLTTQGDKEREM